MILKIPNKTFLLKMAVLCYKILRITVIVRIKMSVNVDPVHKIWSNFDAVFFFFFFFFSCEKGHTGTIYKYKVCTSCLHKQVRVAG